MRLAPWLFVLRFVIVLGALALVLPVGLLIALACVTPITLSGLAYTVGIVLFLLGALAALWRPRAATILMVGGFATMAITAGMRIANRADGAEGSTVRLITLPDEGGTRYVDRLIHERDLSLFGAQVARLTGIGLNRQEYDGLEPTMIHAYKAMEVHGATSASPMFATYLFLQNSAKFDTVVVEPRRSNVAPGAAVIYLHGFTGNFTVQGWLVAQAASRINAVTVAPSVGFIGNWWTPQGRETVRATIAYLRKRGIKRIYLAGLSNGGMGVCRLAPGLKADLNGLILISGADRHAEDAGLPVLALYGSDDARMRPESAKAYIEQAGDRGKYVEFAGGDHLLLAKRADEVRDVFATWLIEQEERSQ